MIWWDWFNTAAGAASLLGLWVTMAATVLGWWWSHTTTRLLKSTSDGIQAVIERTTANTQTLLMQMDNRWKEAFGRMAQRADERHRETIDAIAALRR